MASIDVGTAVAILDAIGCNADPCKALVASRASIDDFELVDDRPACRVKITYFNKSRCVRGTLYTLVADRLRDYGFCRRERRGARRTDAD